MLLKQRSARIGGHYQARCGSRPSGGALRRQQTLACSAAAVGIAECLLGVVGSLLKTRNRCCYCLAAPTLMPPQSSGRGTRTCSCRHTAVQPEGQQRRKDAGDAAGHRSPACAFPLQRHLLRQHAQQRLVPQQAPRDHRVVQHLELQADEEGHFARARLLHLLHAIVCGGGG